jgi:hypothetical protein
MAKYWDMIPDSFGGDLLRQVETNYLREVINLSVKAEAIIFLKKNMKVYDDNGCLQYVASDKTRIKYVRTSLGVIGFSVPVVTSMSMAKAPGIGFHSKIIPSRMATKLGFNSLLSWKYLEGLATNDFTDFIGLALNVFSGCDKRRLSPVMGKVLEASCQKWARRDLSCPNFPFLWVDSVRLRRYGAYRDHRLYAVAGVSVCGVAKLMGVCRAPTPDDYLSWAALFSELKGKGLKELPPVTGALTTEVVKGIRAAYPKFKPPRPDSSAIERVSSQLPQQGREYGTTLLMSILRANTNAQIDERVASFVKNFAQTNTYLAIDLLSPLPYLKKLDSLARRGFFPSHASPNSLCANQPASHKASLANKPGPSKDPERPAIKVPKNTNPWVV